MGDKNKRTPNLEKLFEKIEQSIDGALINRDAAGILIMPLKNYEVCLGQYGTTSFVVRETKNHNNLLHIDSSEESFDRYAEKICGLYDKMYEAYKRYREVFNPLKKADNQAGKILLSLGKGK